MKYLSRRSFVKSASAITAGAAFLPGLMSCSRNDKINLAVIGVGGQGEDSWNQLLDKEYNYVALCDVSDKSAQRGYETFPEARRFKDFRVMMDKMHKEIDAVIIATPDHTHFAAAMTCMEGGKHVYVEKPLAHNVWQLRTLRKAAKHYNVITQMGNQGHATTGIRRAKEWYQAGVLGEVREVFCFGSGPTFYPEDDYYAKPDQYPPKAEPVPDYLDWDLWLGPQKSRPYSHFYLPRYWRGWYDFGNGELGDWACHTIDAPFFALELGMPTSVDVVRRTESPEGFVSDTSHLKFEFAARGDKPPVTLHWCDGGIHPEGEPPAGLDRWPGGGGYFIGDKKIMRTSGYSNNPRLVVPENEWKLFTENLPAPTIPRVKGGPQAEWMRAVKGEGPMPGSNFEYATRLTEMALVGVMAQRFNTRLEYDAENMKMTNHPEFDAYIKEPVREGWSFGEDLW